MDNPRDLMRMFDEVIKGHVPTLRSLTTQGEVSVYCVKYDALSKAIRDLYAAQVPDEALEPITAPRRFLHDDEQP